MSTVFFFSSRRRHTRWPRDWSSDVCSSDLIMEQGRRDPTYINDPDVSQYLQSLGAQLAAATPGSVSNPEVFAIRDRSEERRVGKECRTRWGPEAEQKKGRKSNSKRAGERSR